MTPDGEVRAMVGGVSYAGSQFNRATQALRQPGSAFKPFVFLAALERGWRPDDPVSGARLTVDGWTPSNFGDDYPAEVTVEQALARSINTAAVRLLEEVGRDRAIEMAHRLGVTSALPSHPSLALGAGEVSLLEMTAAYATLAAGGRLVWPEGILTVADADGEVVYRRDPPDDRVLKEDVVRDMVRMMQATMEYGSGRRVALERPSAGKTGTTNDFRDAWFIGFTADLVVGVWVGNDDSSPTRGVTGSGPPATIWHEVMEAAHQDLPARPLLPADEDRAPAPVAAVKGWLDDLVGGVRRLYSEGGWGRRTPHPSD
jgi:penicillin-binding protein 1A